MHLFGLSRGDRAVDEPTYVHSGWAYVHGSFKSVREAPPLVKYLFGFAQELFGQGYTSARVVSALAGIATALIVAVWAYRLVGLVAAISAAAFWGLLPHAGVMGGYAPAGPRIERLALLDPVATGFVALALWAGWEARARGSLPWAALAGLATGWAATSKAPGLLIAPVIVLSFVCTRRLRQEWSRSLALTGSYLATGLAAVVVVYLPLGWHGSFDQIHYMLRFQGAHAAAGHTILIGSKIYQHAPWWAGLRFMSDGIGGFGTALLVILAVIGLLSPARAAAVYGLAATVVTYFGLAIGSGLMLAHYYVIWLPGLVLAAGVGAQAVVKNALRGGWFQTLAVAWSVVLAVMLVSSVVNVATIDRGDYERAAQLIASQGAHEVFVVGAANVMQLALSPSERVHVVASLPARDSRPRAVVADPLTTKRSPSLEKKLEAWSQSVSSAGYRHTRVGRLDVWIREAPGTTTTA